MNRKSLVSCLPRALRNVYIFCKVSWTRYNNRKKRNTKLRAILSSAASFSLHTHHTKFAIFLCWICKLTLAFCSHLPPCTPLVWRLYKTCKTMQIPAFYLENENESPTQKKLDVFFGVRSFANKMSHLEWMDVTHS